MMRILYKRFSLTIATIWFSLAAVAQDEKFDASIAFCGGQTNFIKDARMVYSWRELPADAEGLVRYKDRTRAEQGLLVTGGTADEPHFQLVSFRDLDSIEFDCDVQKLGVSSLEHQFRVERIWLKRRDGARVGYATELLAGDRPIFWPQAANLRFPDNRDLRQIDRRVVALRGMTKIEGQDSEFAFVFPAATSIAIESVVKKQLDAFPRLIRFVHPESAGPDRAER